MEPPVLSAIVLCYRAEESIKQVVGPLHHLLVAAGVPFELVLVANYAPGVADRTPAIVEELAASRENVRVVAEAKRGAMGWDMRSGLAAATGEYLIVIDGDAQNPVEDVIKMFRHMRASGADVMKGRRIARFDGLYRRVVSGTFNAVFVLLFRTRGLWDINAKPKGMTRDAYQRMHLQSDDWFIDAEIILAARRAGLTIAEMPVVFRKNEVRASFVRVTAIAEFMGNMLRARLRGR
jgi:glycosyltransferase involved in cell wall biosynthesis